MACGGRCLGGRCVCGPILKKYIVATGTRLDECDEWTLPLKTDGEIDMALVQKMNDRFAAGIAHGAAFIYLPGFRPRYQNWGRGGH